MARIERKVHYVGTWREDHVTDTTMRQIVARSHAEKGQKAKLKLSRDGLNVTRTVLFQESFLSSFPLTDVYFLTVNPRHPTCLLCIVADPVRKYLILALRTATHLEARDIIDTFQRLKNVPTKHGGDVVLRRKDNGNWTLRERSQHNANRHLQQVFQETSNNTTINTSPSASPPTPSSPSSATSPRLQPNGHVVTSTTTTTSSTATTTQFPPPSPFFDTMDGGGVVSNQTSDNAVAVAVAAAGGGRMGRAHSASQTAEASAGGGVGGVQMVEGSEEEMAQMKLEVETLNQELRDLKLLLEEASTLRTRSSSNGAPTIQHHSNNTTTTTSNNHHHPSDKSHYIQTEVQTPRTSASAGQGTNNGGAGAVVTAYSDGGDYPSQRRAGEARVFVDDHRADSGAAESARAGKPGVVPQNPKPLLVNARGLQQRQITVPEPNNGPSAANGGYYYSPHQHGRGGSYTVQRQVYRQPARDVHRKPSTAHSLRSAGTGTAGGISIVPALSARVRRGHDEHQFRSMRVSRTSGVPTTIVRPIEEIYSRGVSGGSTLRRQRVMVVQTPVPTTTYVGVPPPHQQQQQQPQHYNHHHHHQSGAVYMDPAVYLERRAQIPTSSSHGGPTPAYSASVSARSPRVNGELDDVFL